MVGTAEGAAKSAWIRRLKELSATTKAEKPPPEPKKPKTKPSKDASSVGPPPGG
jgi:hypothetical protein